LGGPPPPVTTKDMLSRAVLLIGMTPEVLREIHDHAWKMATGAATAQERGVPAEASWLSDWVPYWLRERLPSVQSRAVAGLMGLDGLGLNALTTMLGLPAMKRYAPFMIGPRGFTFPRQVMDAGLLSKTGDTTIFMSFFNPVPGSWHHGALAGETVHQTTHQSSSGSSKSMTLSTSVQPNVV